MGSPWIYRHGAFSLQKNAVLSFELLFSTQSLLCVLKKTSLWITSLKVFDLEIVIIGRQIHALESKHRHSRSTFQRQIDKVRTKHKSCQRHTFSEFYSFWGNLFLLPKPLIDRLFWGLRDWCWRSKFGFALDFDYQFYIQINQIHTVLSIFRGGLEIPQARKLGSENCLLSLLCYQILLIRWVYWVASTRKRLVCHPPFSLCVVRS